MGGRKGHSVSPRQRRNEPERRKRLSLGNIGSLATSGSFRKRRSSKGMSVTLDTSPVNADSPTGHSEEESDYFRGRASSLFVPCLPIPARDENSAPEMISPRSASPRSDSLISPRPASASPTSPSISPRPGGGSRVKFSSHPPQKTDAGDVQNRRKRTIEEQEQYELVREELLDTERSYVHDLRILLEVYKQPLEERKIIPKETCQELFRNVEALLPLNEELLNQMESIRKQSPSLRGKMPPERPSRCMPVDVRPTPNAQQSVISVKVEKESTVKSILVDNTTTVREAVDIVLDRLAWDSEERLLQLQSDYAFCILVDHTTRRVCDSDKPLLPQLSPPAESGGHPLVVLKRSVKDVTDLGECFMQLGVYLKMYSEYCNNQPAASKLYAELIEENDAFYHFIEECREKEVVRNLDLEAFLILPLQRLCKYPLFLKQLIQLTPHLHPSYQSLQSALEVIENAVSATDSRKHEMEVSQMMWDLQNRIKGNIKFQIFAPHRRFICKGPVQYFIPRDNSINSLGHYYLFSDLLVVTSREEKGKQSRLIFQTQVADIVHCVEDTKYSVKVTSLTKEHPRAPATRCSIILIFPEENLKAQFHSSMEEQENAHAAAHLSAHRSPSGIPSVESRRPTIGKRRPPMVGRHSSLN